MTLLQKQIKYYTIVKYYIKQKNELFCVVDVFGCFGNVIDFSRMSSVISIYFYFISIFILLSCRKVTEALIHRVSNHPDLLPEMPRYCCTHLRNMTEI